MLFSQNKRYNLFYICSFLTKQYLISFGSGNGLVTRKHQAISFSSDDLVPLTENK